MINLSGSVTVDTIDVYVTMNYEETQAPSEASFHFTTEGMSVSGSCSKNEITYYTTSQGIVTDGLMKKVETKVKECIANYESI